MQVVKASSPPLELPGTYAMHANLSKSFMHALQTWDVTSLHFFSIAVKRVCHCKPENMIIVSGD
jgi:hypothetical protein